MAQWNHLGDFDQINGDERCLLPAELWGRDEDYLWYSTGGAAYFTDLAKGILGEGTLQARYIRGAFDDKPFTLGKYESTRIRVAIAELAANGGAPMGFYTRFTRPAGPPRDRPLLPLPPRDTTPSTAPTAPTPRSCCSIPRRRSTRATSRPSRRSSKLGRRLLDDHVLFDVLPDDLATPERLAGYRKVVDGLGGREAAPISPPGPQPVRGPDDGPRLGEPAGRGGRADAPLRQLQPRGAEGTAERGLGDRRREAARGRGDQGRSPPAPRDPGIGRAGDVTRGAGARGAADRDGRRAGPVRDARVPGLRRGPGETGRLEAAGQAVGTGR